MTKELATNNSAEMLITLRNTVAPGLTDAEFQLFAEIVKATGLNPMTKEIWAIKAGGRLQLMTGINGFLRIANSHPMFDGMEVEFEWDGKTLLAATAKVYRKDRRFPSVATAYMTEYAKQSPIWKTMPSIMLSKCAKSLAIREAFIQELGGLYTTEEMPAEYGARATNIVESRVAPVQVIDTKTGELLPSPAQKVAEDDDLPEWSTAAKIVEEVKAKKTRAKTTYYNLESCPGEQVKAAESYLVVAGAKRITETHWKSSIKLEKLTQFIDESFCE